MAPLVVALACGVEASLCSKRTGGTCSKGPLSTCGQSSVEVGCINGQCFCQQNYCTRGHMGRFGEICEPSDEYLERMKEAQIQSHCGQDTGGTCNLMSCSQFRGPVNCIKAGWFYHCICKPGYCSANGRCVAAVGPQSAELLTF
eukprot:TRINITY_DN35425_c0_g1_i1.p1 TRINITY_DN35425_c0_g1~~TRINITY_DN35425_c0_g1_i1.p1  ORF type:complete len:165 (-),score=22.82 TRINITY_DN35425_c0_g1_i1:124-555(-)